MAAAAVSGGAALALAAKPSASLQELRNSLLYSGETIASLNGKTRTGKRLNLRSVINTINENDVTPPSPATNLQITASTGRNITLQWTAPGDDGNTGTAADYDFVFASTATGRQWFLPATVIPAAGGTVQTTVLQLPYRGAAGTLQLQTFDNAGNSSLASIPVNVPHNALIDPYVQTLSPAAALTTGGTALAVIGDNTFKENVALPFPFPYFGTNRTTVTVSSNGSLFFSKIPQATIPGAPPQVVGLDSGSSTQGLQRLAQIAGLWDHLRTDRGGNVFMVTDTDRVVFRWQAVTFGDGTPAQEFPVNFEIELRRDGTIVMRYGAGQSAPINTNVAPVVGISAGEPDAYIEDTHTSEFGPIDLTNAQTITFTPAISSLQFSASNYSVGEADGSVTITVTRSGDTSGTASVDYKTADTDTFTVGCSDTVGNLGGAFARCDFATSVDTLTFGAGETSKTLQVPIINDSIAEGNETFTVVLSNAMGATLGSPSTATVTITDNETVTGPNPIFTTPFFVRQHYLDFLSREPEVGEPWSAVLNNCSDVNNNPACDRLTVSGAFFGSPEFQLKGYFVYRFYKLAFNRLPLYTEIVTDMRAVTGQTPAEVFQKKATFTNGFVQRTEFTNTYGTMMNAQYVNVLMRRYSLTQITTPDPANPDGTNKVTLTTADLTNQLNATTLTRAQVLRAIADSDQVFSLEFNQAFVAMQYYGYLRRIPEPAGFNGWLDYLNAHPTDSRTMVNGFMNSAEYRLRFGPAQ
jgi:hypothetical protein